MPNLETLSFRDIAKMSDEQARSTFEAIRWPNGPTCPRCGGTNASVVQGGRAGLYRCLDCRKAKTADQFSVTVGSIFEDSHIGLSKWLQAFSIMCASKKGVSALQLQRQLELGSYRSAWHMAHRIRHAMESTPSSPLLGGPKKAVEVDETYVGGRPRNRHVSNKKFSGAATKKAPVIALIERGGRMRAIAVGRASHENIQAAVRAHVDRASRLNTDEHSAYKRVGKEFKGGHRAVKHSALEYARGSAHVNTCESFFALLKRGVHGTFHHVSKKHLGRYCDEFSFRWDHRKVTDADRTGAALRQSRGRRLMLKDLVGKMVG